jgi:hypothetical protein
MSRKYELSAHPLYSGDLTAPSSILLCTLQMVLAIECCHKYGFIHRDIKPDVCSIVQMFWSNCLHCLFAARIFFLTQMGTSNSVILDWREFPSSKRRRDRLYLQTGRTSIGHMTQHVGIFAQTPFPPYSIMVQTTSNKDCTYYTNMALTLRTATELPMVPRRNVLTARRSNV